MVPSLMSIDRLRADLLAEQVTLDALVAPIGSAGWETQTPSPGWSVRDQIAHLAYFDEAAAAAIDDPDAFAELAAELVATMPEGDRAVDDLTLGWARRGEPVVERWRAARWALAEAARSLAPTNRVPWYGPEMGAMSFLSARLMECWAHGQDVVDALGLDRPATDRLQHIAQLGFNTRGWSYLNRGLPPPVGPIRVELEAPSGSTWTFGSDDASESVRGDAEAFCLVVVQRRHLDDTDLLVTPAGREWLLLAQAFAGPATDGPAAGTR